MIFDIKNNKTGLQSVSRPVEQVVLLTGFGWMQRPVGAKAMTRTRTRTQHTSRHTETEKPKNPHLTRKVTHTLSMNNDCTKYIKRAPVGAKINKKLFL